MKQQTKIYVVIAVVEKDKKFLTQCIKSLKEAAKYAGIRLEIIIIANGTKVNKLSKHLFNCKIFINKQNIGFGKAINQGIEKVRGKWFIVAAPDIKCDSSTIKNLIRPNLDKNIAIVGPKIYFPNGDIDCSIQPLINLWNIFLEQSYLYKLIPSFFNHPFANKSIYKFIREVNGLASTFWLIKKEAFASINGFDPRFFLFFDDADLCNRLIKHGYKIIYNPTATIIHFSHQSNEGIINAKLHLDGLNKYLSKYHSKLYSSIGITLVMIGSLMRLVYWQTRKIFRPDTLNNKKIAYLSDVITNYFRLITSPNKFSY